MCASHQPGCRTPKGINVALCTLALLAGCASPGVPRPPSLHLPAPVHDLTAQRHGASVDLRFTAPQETTDHQSLLTKHGPAPLTAVVCRVEGVVCRPFTRLAVTPGASYETQDVLPPGLSAGPPRPLAYRVTLLNKVGRDAGPSRDSIAAAGEAPPPVTGLAATTRKQGVELAWQAVPGSTVQVQAESQKPDAASAGKTPSIRLLRPAGGSDPGGAVDPVPAVGQPVTYRVFRVWTGNLAGVPVRLEGAAGQVTVTRAPDTFPPAVPTGVLTMTLTAPSGKPEVELSWEANSEPDLLGYFVYRVSANVKGNPPFTRLNTTPVAGVSFEDTAVHPGESYRYAVSAVDRAGNESARSTPQQVAVQP